MNGRIIHVDTAFKNKASLELALKFELSEDVFLVVVASYNLGDGKIGCFKFST